MPYRGMTTIITRSDRRHCWVPAAPLSQVLGLPHAARWWPQERRKVRSGTWGLSSAGGVRYTCTRGSSSKPERGILQRQLRPDDQVPLSFDVGRDPSRHG